MKTSKNSASSMKAVADGVNSEKSIFADAMSSIKQMAEAGSYSVFLNFDTTGELLFIADRLEWLGYKVEPVVFDNYAIKVSWQ